VKPLKAIQAADMYGRPGLTLLEPWVSPAWVKVRVDLQAITLLQTEQCRGREGS